MGDLPHNSNSSVLSDVSPGHYSCSRLALVDVEAQRIQRLGICEGRPLVVLAIGDPMILLVSGSQIGISRQLAEQVSVIGT